MGVSDAGIYTSYGFPYSGATGTTRTLRVTLDGRTEPVLGNNLDGETANALHRIVKGLGGLVSIISSSTLSEQYLGLSPDGVIWTKIPLPELFFYPTLSVSGSSVAILGLTQSSRIRLYTWTLAGGWVLRDDRLAGGSGSSSVFGVTSFGGVTTFFGISGDVPAQTTVFYVYTTTNYVAFSVTNVPIAGAILGNSVFSFFTRSDGSLGIFVRRTAIDFSDTSLLLSNAGGSWVEAPVVPGLDSDPAVLKIGSLVFTNIAGIGTTVRVADADAVVASNIGELVEFTGPDGVLVDPIIAGSALGYIFVVTSSPPFFFGTAISLGSYLATYPEIVFPSSIGFSTKLVAGPVTESINRNALVVKDILEQLVDANLAATQVPLLTIDLNGKKLFRLVSVEDDAPKLKT